MEWANTKNLTYCILHFLLWQAKLRTYMKIIPLSHIYIYIYILWGDKDPK